jgi:hypothetical protein
MKNERRVEHFLEQAQEFAHKNKNVLVIIGDPETDHLFAAYNDSMINGRIKSLSGKKQPVVKQVLAFSKFSSSLDKFTFFKFKADILIAEIAELLWLPIGKSKQFFMFLSDALWFIPKGANTQNAIMNTKGSKPTNNT